MKKVIFTFLYVFTLINISNAQMWNQRLNGRSVWSLAKAPQPNVIYAGGLTGANSRIWRSSDLGFSWDTIYTGTGQTMWDIAFDQNANMYVANFSNGLLKSTNNGTSFEVIPVSQFNNKNPQGVECGNAGYVYVSTAQGFFMSSNGGANWSESATLVGNNCLPIVVDKDSSNIVYVGVTSAGGLGIGFYRSTDFGVTFGANLNPGKNGYGIIQLPINGDLYMITTTSPYNFDRSTNKGLSWSTVSNAPNAMRGIAWGVDGFFIGGNGGVFVSTSLGMSWSNFNFTSSATPVMYSFPYIYTGTSGSSGGVWFTSWPLINIQPINNIIPEKYELKQNYPNPFNPETKIEFSIPGKTNVRIIVYDSKGSEVAKLLQQELGAGIYSVNFEGKGLNSGIYFYRIETDKYSEVKKMVLLK
ncbi:MAG TPA: hypothetical protein DEP28_07795 [Bacteroidetes bacterium]|nr:T9SS type A sorting domain-containing protein [Ignavibacteria bacterium]HCA43139.1 hypothetical protein [Bacteroidota bacterium]HCN36315.1 hypothetical protein [Bacteroidota bacterium]